MTMSRSQISSLAIVIGLALGGVLAGSAAPPPSANRDAERILAQFERQNGFRPKALRLLAQRPDALSAFMSYGKSVFKGGPPNEKERYLVALSAAVTLKSPDCIKAHSRRAWKFGATEKEIEQTALVAAVVSNGSALHIAYDSLTTEQ